MSRLTEAQRAADALDAIEAARSEGNTLQAARLWVAETARRVDVARAALRYEQELPKDRQNSGRTRKAQDALAEAIAVLDRAKDAARPLEIEDAAGGRQEGLFARVHRNFNQGGKDA